MNNIKNTLVQQQKIIYLKEWKHIKVTLEEYKTENKDALNEKERQRNRTSERVAYQKERYDKIKEKELEQSRKRYQEKKEQILARQKEKIICICGCTVTRNEISQHKKTKKHNNLMKNINI